LAPVEPIYDLYSRSPYTSQVSVGGESFDLTDHEGKVVCFKHISGFLCAIDLLVIEFQHRIREGPNESVSSLVSLEGALNGSQRWRSSPTCGIFWDRDKGLPVDVIDEITQESVIVGIGSCLLSPSGGHATADSRVRHLPFELQNRITGDARLF
jgi:hypothetical protein